MPSQPAEAVPIPPSLGPSHILTHDVNRLLSYIHEVDQSRTSEHHELSESIRAIREELLDIHGLLIDREERVVEVPVLAPAPVPAPEAPAAEYPPQETYQQGFEAPAAF